MNATATFIGNATTASTPAMGFAALGINVNECPAVAPFFGYIGVAAAVIFANVGAAYGTAKAGVGIMISGISSPELVWRNLIPIIMAGVNGIYGLITAIILIGSMATPTAAGNHYSLYTGFGHLASGLCCGLTAMGSGMAIGLAGDSSVRACGAFDVESKKMQLIQSLPTVGGGDGGKKKKKAGGGDQLFVAMVLIQVFAGNLGLYGLITSIIISQANYICP